MDTLISSGLPQGQRLWVQQTWVWHKPSWRMLPLTHHRTSRTYTGLGKQTFEGHKQNLVSTRTWERNSDPTRNRPRLTCEYLGVTSGGMGWQWPATGLGALSVAVPAWDLLKEVSIVFIISSIAWPQVNNREGTQPHASTENWIKDLLKVAPSIRTRPSFP